MKNLNNLVQYLQAKVLEKILNNIPENTILEKREISGTIIYKSPEVTTEEYNISRCLYFNRYNEIVIEFVKKLEYNFSHCDLYSFYKNMLTVEIKDNIVNPKTIKYKINNKRKALASYYPLENNIELFNYKNYIHNLFHELLHLSSRKKIGKKVLVGFAQLESKKRFGVYLNEGYTEYINQKYFSKEDKKGYPGAITFVQGIEKIVGRKKMEKLYFDADLLGLINELGMYYPKEEVVNLINRMDCYYKEIRNDNDEAYKTYEEILKVIANIQKNKLSKELAEGTIDEVEYRRRKLLYCDDYEDGRINSENVSVQEYDDYFLIIDNDTHESHYYMKPPTAIENKDGIVFRETNLNKSDQHKVKEEDKRKK